MRISETQLHKLIKESIRKVLKEEEIVSNSNHKIRSEGDRSRRSFKDNASLYSSGKGDRLTFNLNTFVRETLRLIDMQFQDLIQKYADAGVNIEQQVYSWERAVRKALVSDNFINFAQGIIK